MDIAGNRILVVDDEPEITDLLKCFLSAKGYKVECALSGEEALGIVDEKRPDLVLLDIRMPGIRGTEVARIIKNRYPSVKIIVITGYADDAQGLSDDNTLTGFFVKPLQLQELYKKISQAFRCADEPSNGRGCCARVISIKARLLFLESDYEIYSFFCRNLKSLSRQGEDYEMDITEDRSALEGKISLFNPEILIINAAALNNGGINIYSDILGRYPGLKEVLLYNAECFQKLRETELDRMIKSIRAVCIRNGLIDIKVIDL